MTLTDIASRAPDAAIFSRNHKEYLQDAADLADGRPVTFRAGATWRAAAAALEAHGPRRVYFSSVGGTGCVEYQATLERVLLYPIPGTEETLELLGNCPPRTRDEGLWEDHPQTVRTLYVISGCRKLDDPFPYTILRKLSDGTPIDGGYHYSYAMVHELDT